MNLVSDAHLKL